MAVIPPKTPNGAKFITYPTIFKITLEILSKEVLEGLFHGKHKSILHGFSSEFKEFKSYEQGENPRNIDWKLFGKTDKLYTKTYQSQLLDVELIVRESTTAK